MENIDLSVLVIESVKETLREIDDKDPSEMALLDESTSLIGANAVLTSLGLVSTIIDIEQKLADNHGISVTIADERAMCREKSPFLTIGTLAEYVSILINGQTQSSGGRAGQA